MSLEDIPEQQVQSSDTNYPTQIQQAISALIASLHRFIETYKAYRKEHDANERQKYTWEKWTARGVWLYTGLTAVIVGISVYQARISRETLQETEATNTANLRAWVGPAGAHSDVPVLNQDLKIQIVFGNSGREPALDAGYALSGFPTYKDINVPDDGLNEAVDALISKCKHGEDIIRVGAVYPSSGMQSYAANGKFPKEYIDQSVVDGTKNLIAAGCFVYKTQGAVHYTSFAVAYGTKLAGVSPSTWSFFPHGNDAD